MAMTLTPTGYRLNAINRAFYLTTAANFDESRGRPWPGWDRVLEHVVAPVDGPLRVLDVGCGNGRFGRFLAKRLRDPVIYHGIDSSQALLTRAKADLATYERITPLLELRDVIETPLPVGAHDVVAAFGVLHHVPGDDFRRAWLRQLAERVAPGGVLAFSAWCFYEFERFRARIVPFPDDLRAEPHDYLLDWRRGHAPNAALRYCHYINEAEHSALVTATGLTEIARYRADGHTGNVNRYSLLRRNEETP